MVSELVIEKDIQQAAPDARRCRSNSDHGRLTVMGSGAEMGCFNRISEAEGKALHVNGKPVDRLEGSKKFICAYREPLSIG